MAVHILGIRHHGPGSARNVRLFLEAEKPDLVLVEGPPEGDAMLQWVVHQDLRPPVALLCYQPDEPQRSVFYPFAEFSPEWQAIQYARQKNIPVRFCDLPVSHQVAFDKEAEEALPEKEALVEEENFDFKADPIAYLAEAAGYKEGEKWWEQMFEYRRDSAEVFEAVAEAMEALRTDLKLKENKVEKLREAHMRRMIRQAEKDLYSSIAVICGAWHVPALLKKTSQKEDNDLLKGLPKVKIDCTWVPWTYNRLSFYSGYGAGIQSPGWYDHLWNYLHDDGTRWMAKVAALFRGNGMDTSVAHVIEAVRLAETLASIRGLSKAGLEELTEATQSVLCNGETIQLQVVQKELIVSNRIGEVPVDIPKPPLQVDIEKQQKSLRLPAAADFKDYTLDLRKELDLSRSIFLHRLRLLRIVWGVQSHVSGKGTFKEQWRLQWDPAFSIEIIEKGVWGNTVEEAANSYVIHQAAQTTSLLNVSELLEAALPSELTKAVQKLIQQIDNLAAASSDVFQLMEALPPLVNVSRYGNVRQTDSGLVLEIVASMALRICIGLPNAVININEESAQRLLELIQQINASILLLQNQQITEDWQRAIGLVAKNENTSPVVSGYANRLLADSKILKEEELVRQFGFHMSAAHPPDRNAAWLEGFLKGSGTILLIDYDLWNMVNQWVDNITPESFIQLLPILRRTFANFTPPERKKLGQKVTSGKQDLMVTLSKASGLNNDRAVKGIPIVLRLLGYKIQ